MKKLLFALSVLTFLCACQGSEDGAAGNQAGAARGDAEPGSGAGKSGGRLSTLVGLYEGGSVQQPNQMCVREGNDGDARFGLVVWGENMQSCSGSGTVDRRAESLVLKMAGDETCVLEARINGTSVTLPSTVPDGCAYYCAPNARLADASFTQKGTTAEDAAKAKDLVGDPLCGGD